jgi:hypothetical protein
VCKVFCRGGSCVAGSLFTAQAYHGAAIEHLALAMRLADAREYLAAHYFAGVAVEAILRAHALRRRHPFTSSHSIMHLAELAGMVEDGRRGIADDLQADLVEVETRWRANHRYLSTVGLAAYLHRTGLDQRVRGDLTKFSARRMVKLAGAIVAIGDARWK